MKLVYGMCGLGLAQAIALGYGQADKADTAVATGRKLESGLCTSSGANSIETVQPFCANKIQTLATDVEWTPCCTFNQDPNDGEMCRSFATEGVYCDDTTQDCTAVLTAAGHSLTIDLEFNTLPQDESCCRSCTCFGDPECVSFNGVADLWIPCDGRRSDCRIRKQECISLTDPNGNQCLWMRQNSITTRGWNIAMRGSPCVPDFANGPDITMNMYTNPSGDFDMHLTLGERGVITAVDLRGSIGSKLTSENCFEYPDSYEAWTGLGAMPTGWSVQATASGKEVRWTIFDGDNGVLVKLLCSRAMEDDTPGPPRINVEEISVASSETGGEGFCETNTISEAASTLSIKDSTPLHEKCVQDRADPLQACKHLVSMAATLNELEQCGEQFCSTADLSNADRSDCASDLGGSPDLIEYWNKYYCMAIMNKDLADGPNNQANCEAQVRAQGYNFASSTWGNGAKVAVESTSCASSISEYALENRQECEDGLMIQVEENGVWVDAYWIPSTLKPCNDQLVVQPAEAPLLFSRKIRMRQCDVKVDEKCKAIGSCAATVGADFKLTYTSTSASLQDLLDRGILVCQDDGSGTASAQTWCIPGSSNYEPSKLCPCPDDTRRVLLGQ